MAVIKAEPGKVRVLAYLTMLVVAFCKIERCIFWFVTKKVLQKTLDKSPKICDAALRYIFFMKGKPMNFSEEVKSTLWKKIDDVDLV